MIPLRLLSLTVLLFSSPLLISSSPLSSSSPSSSQPVEYVDAELYPSPHDGSAALIEDWSNYIMHLSGLNQHGDESVLLEEPGTQDHFYPGPDQRSLPEGDEWVRVGSVLPTDITHFTEGYRPLHGFFVQSAQCDQFMRMWLDQCAMKDESDNVYHKKPAEFFQEGSGEDRSSSYLKRVMESWESESNMAKSQQRFGGLSRSEDGEGSTDVDDRATDVPSEPELKKPWKKGGGGDGGADE